MSGSATKPGELELLQAVLAGQLGAFGQFYGRYERLIIACVRRVYARYGVACGSDEVDDLCNTVCLQLIRDDHRKLRGYDKERGYRLSSWIGLIATNAAHDALRRRPPAAQSIDDESTPWTEPHADQPDPEEIAALREQQARLNRAVQHLSPSDQLFLRYYYGEQRTPDEIAELMGIAINTVYSRKNKVRASLKRILQEIDSLVNTEC